MASGDMNVSVLIPPRSLLDEFVLRSPRELQSNQNIVFVETRMKHVKIQTIASRPYIPETLHVKLDRQRTDRTVTNNINLGLKQCQENQVRGDMCQVPRPPPAGSCVFPIPHACRSCAFQL